MPQMSKARKPRNPAGRRGAPVSLYPLSFEDAVTGLAQVQMPAKPKRRAQSQGRQGQMNQRTAKLHEILLGLLSA